MRAHDQLLVRAVNCTRTRERNVYVREKNVYLREVTVLTSVYMGEIAERAPNKVRVFRAFKVTVYARESLPVWRL